MPKSIEKNLKCIEFNWQKRHKLLINKVLGFRFNLMAVEKAEGDLQEEIETPT